MGEKSLFDELAFAFGFASGLALSAAGHCRLINHRRLPFGKKAAPG